MTNLSSDPRVDPHHTAAETFVADLYEQTLDSLTFAELADSTVLRGHAIDGEIDCGVELFHLTSNGVLIAEVRILAGVFVRPIVLATVEAIMRSHR